MAVAAAQAALASGGHASPALAGHRRRPSIGSSWASPASRPSISSPCSSMKASSPAAQYERLEANIGEGTYGKVHKARDLRTGKIVAIKKAKASQVDRDVGGIGFIALREIKLMQAVKHPNVMGCLDVFADGGTVHLVMEFMDGDFKKLIEEKTIGIPEAAAKCLAQQLLQGVAALHCLWFLHRDITPNNVLLSFNTGVAKLCDFGFARTIGHGADDKPRPLTPMCTTLWYRAPELLYGAKFYGPAVDMWSTGCVIAELFTREALFRGRGEFDMLTKVFEKRGTPSAAVWEGVSALPSYVEFSQHAEEPMSQIVPSASNDGQAFLGSLLQLDPKRRPSAEEALRDGFFTCAAPQACEPGDLPFVGRVPREGDDDDMHARRIQRESDELRPRRL